MARVRSPNYPAISLGAAVEKARAIHKGEGKNAVSREALAKLLGYGGLNGGSATMLSALGKYGLIESVSDGEARITDLAMRILHPESSAEKTRALQEAAFKPAIFAEIQEKWPERPPGDESLRSFLIRKGFTEAASDQVIQFYREIIDMAGPVKSVQDSPPTHDPKEATVSHQGLTGVSLSAAAQPIAPPPLDRAFSASPPLATLGNGKPFTVSFDGTILTGSIAIKSVRDIERLMKVLQAQKAAFEAMQEDEDGAADL